MEGIIPTQLIKQHFKLDERKTTIHNEIHAGVSTFLTMSYIILVNPQVLSKIGIPAGDIVVSTSLASAIGSILTGLFGNLPFGLAPGIGLSAYLAYGLVLNEGMSLHQAFTACFISASLLLFFTISGITAKIMCLIPSSVKMATIVGMGLQIALVGMEGCGMVVGNPRTVVEMGPINNYKMWLSLTGLVLIGSLLFHQIRGAILVGILLLTMVQWCIDGKGPEAILSWPKLQNTVEDYISLSPAILIPSSSSSSSSSTTLPFLSSILSFLFVALIDVSGVVFGMSSLARLTLKDGHVPGGFYAFVGCGVGSIISALTGGTPLIVYVESAAGIKEGARSGLSAVVVGLLFLLSLFFSPLLSSIPVTATAPVSILVGGMMMGQATEIDWEDMREAIPAFLTLSVIPFTFSITNGIILGLLSALLLRVTTGPESQMLASWLKGVSAGEGAGVEEVGDDFDDGNMVLESVEMSLMEQNGLGDMERKKGLPLPIPSQSPTSSSSLPITYQSLPISISPSPPHSPSFNSLSISNSPTLHKSVRTPSLVLSKKDAEAVRKAAGMSLD